MDSRGVRATSSWHGLNVGDELDLDVKQRARNGSGVTRFEGCIIFVKGAKPGERVRVRITDISARHAHAVVVQHLPDESVRKRAREE